MSEFLLELFTEEMPPALQKSAKEDLLLIFKNFLNQKNIAYHKINFSISTPNRLIIYFKSIQKKNLQKNQRKLEVLELI